MQLQQHWLQRLLPVEPVFEHCRQLLLLLLLLA
jgi:hypothetical protein